MPKTPQVSARPNRFGLRNFGDDAERCGVLVNSSSCGLSLAFELEAVTERPRRILLDR